MKKIKLSGLLAVTDQLSSSYKQSLQDYTNFFKNSQGAFRGERKTYVPRLGTVDEPRERSLTLVVTTVEEKLDWLEETQAKYIDSLFLQEAMNASGLVKADLIVEGVNFGSYSSLELLRLKSLLESPALVAMYEHLPVRSDSIEWDPTTEEMYEGRDIFETVKTSGVKKTTVKDPYILQDPNVATAPDRYTPVTAQRDVVFELGDYTLQNFSGETSQRRKAEILRRRQILLVSVIEALKEANDIEATTFSEMTSRKLFGYLHGKTPTAATAVKI